MSYPNRKLSEIEKFFHHIVKSGTCWLWSGVRNSDGYGRFFLNGKYVQAHRYSYEYFVDQIKENFEIDHKCRVRNCVNPTHLEPVLHIENVMRGIGISSVNKKKKYCVRGHEFTSENTISCKNGTARNCRICMREYQKNYRNRN